MINIICALCRSYHHICDSFANADSNCVNSNVTCSKKLLNFRQIINDLKRKTTYKREPCLNKMFPLSQSFFKSLYDSHLKRNNNIRIRRENIFCLMFLANIYEIYVFHLFCKCDTILIYLYTRIVR